MNLRRTRCGKIKIQKKTFTMASHLVFFVDSCSGVMLAFVYWSRGESLCLVGE